MFVSFFKQICLAGGRRQCKEQRLSTSPLVFVPLLLTLVTQDTLYPVPQKELAERLESGMQLGLIAVRND